MPRRVEAMSSKQIQELPAAVDIPTAGGALGIGRSKAYRLAKSGQFPVEVLPLGAEFRVTRASICAYLGIEDIYARHDAPASPEAA